MSSVHYLHTVIHKAFTDGSKVGTASRNVADGVDVPKAKRTEMQTWDANEIDHFLAVVKESNSPYYALFFLALFTGARRGELLALRWSDVDLLLCQLSINRSLHQLRDRSYVFTQPKTAKSRRTVALPPSAIRVLSEHHNKQSELRLQLGIPLSEQDLVFARYDGKPLRPNSVPRAWAIIVQSAGVKFIRLHDARHTHASLMLKQGIHPKIVQERLGHLRYKQRWIHIAMLHRGFSKPRLRVLTSNLHTAIMTLSQIRLRNEFLPNSCQNVFM